MSTFTQGAVIEGDAVDELRSSFRGDLIRPDDARYDEHRQVWNGSIDRRPGLIARCAGVADVRAAVRFARERDLLVAVRGGGHSFPGLSVCDGIADCPDELMTIVVQRRAPALPAVPADLVGKLVVAVIACYAGPVEAGERVMQPLKSFGSHVLDLCEPKPFLTHQ